jgi:hypothetical protein
MSRSASSKMISEVHGLQVGRLHYEAADFCGSSENGLEHAKRPFVLVGPYVFISKNGSTCSVAQLM